jgi:hypothetical protein
MRLGVPFIAPRQLGAIESNPGRQFLPSVAGVHRPRPRREPSPGVGRGEASYGARSQTWLLSASLCRVAQQSERRRRRCPLVSLPFLKTLRCAKDFAWGPEQAAAFASLKQHLSELATLTSPDPSLPLLLYVAASPHAVSAALVQEQDREGTTR